MRVIFGGGGLTPTTLSFAEIMQSPGIYRLADESLDYRVIVTAQQKALFYSGYPTSVVALDNTGGAWGYIKFIKTNETSVTLSFD